MTKTPPSSISSSGCSTLRQRSPSRRKFRLSSVRIIAAGCVWCYGAIVRRMQGVRPEWLTYPLDRVNLVAYERRRRRPDTACRLPGNSVSADVRTPQRAGCGHATSSRCPQTCSAFSGTRRGAAACSCRSVPSRTRQPPATLRHRAAPSCSACVPAAASLPWRSLHAAHPCSAADQPARQCAGVRRMRLTPVSSHSVATLRCPASLRAAGMSLYRRSHESCSPCLVTVLEKTSDTHAQLGATERRSPRNASSLRASLETISVTVRSSTSGVRTAASPCRHGRQSRQKVGTGLRGLAKIVRPSVRDSTRVMAAGRGRQ